MFPTNKHRGVIRIGEHCLNFLDRSSNPNIWNVEDGTIIFKGSCFLNQGTKICVNDGAILEFGDHFTCTGNSSFICNKGIKIGCNCLFSWDILLLDSDHHEILDSNENVINDPARITIGNHVWLGCRSTVLKGVQIADNNIVACGSILSKSNTIQNVILGGIGNNQTIIRRNINFRV